jgi:DNA polymerase III alpha subunit (gram-positive type)
MICDIETTGLDKFKDQPIQIAYLVTTEQDRRKVQEQGCFFVVPDKRITQFITRKTGITNEMVRTRGYANHVATGLWHKLVWKYQPCRLVGHNFINFDLHMILNWLERFHPNKFKHPPLTEVVDTMFLAQKRLKTRKWPKLSKTAIFLKIPFVESELHNAVADVELTWKVYRELKKGD